MKGGHLNNGHFNKNYLDIILSKELDTDVTNMACPGRGNELYLDNMIYAKKRFNTKLFIVELSWDRNWRTMLVPNYYMKQQSEKTNIDALYTRDLDNIYNNCKINISRGSKSQENKLKESEIGSTVPLSKIIKYNNFLNVFREHEYIMFNLNIKKLITSVQDFCSITNTHVLWQVYHTHALNAYMPFLYDYISPDILINNKIQKGVQDWGTERGFLCDDQEHLTVDGDKEYVKKVLAPYVKTYCTNHSIIF